MKVRHQNILIFKERRLFVYAIQTSGGAAAAAHSRCGQDALLSIEARAARSVAFFKIKKIPDDFLFHFFFFSFFPVIPEEQRSTFETPSG